jgi:hypothetical protein
LLGKHSVTLFIILSLLSSILSVALTSSEQINQSFGAETSDNKPKEKKSDSISDSKPKKDDKSKDKIPTKEEDTKSKDEDKSKDKIIIKENDDDKPKDEDKTKTNEVNNPQQPVTDTTQTLTANDKQPLITGPTQPPCDPTIANCPPVTGPTQPPCDPTIANCPPVISSNENTRCPADFRMGSDGFCHVISCTLPKDQCPPPCDVKKGQCSTGIKCKPDYHRGADGFCHLVNCTLPKDQCPPPVCDLFTEVCYWNEKCKTNSTESCEKHHKESSSTDTVIKYYITNPIIQKQVAQQPSNVLIPMNTIQFCNLIGDQACVFMNSNFKILFNQTSKDNLGNWILNGEAQNIGPNPLNNVIVVWHLYDAFGNIVGLTQGIPIPSSLGIGQTTIFNLQENPISLTGIPKFYRISFVF